MGIIAIITIAGFVIVIIYLQAIKTVLEMIRRIVEKVEKIDEMREEAGEVVEKLEETRANIEAIREMVEMSENERFDYNMRIDNPEAYCAHKEIEMSEQMGKMKAKK